MKYRRLLLLASFVAAGLCSGAPAANAVSGASGLFPGTWYHFSPSRCLHQNTSGVTYLYIVNYDGRQLWTSEPDLVASFTEVCMYGGNFFAYSTDGSSWSYSSYTSTVN